MVRRAKFRLVGAISMDKLVGALAGLLLGCATSALADPITYSGKIGSLDVVVELTDDPAASDGPLAGRYFYRAKGVDIPLQAKSRKGGSFELAEEEACGAEKCGEGQAAPIGAVWKLTSTEEGKTLEGTWTAKKSLPVKLTRAGSREGSAAENPYGLYSDTDMAVFADGADITTDEMPYDYLRVDVAMDEGPKAGWPDASYRYVTDPRTKFARPRIVELAGGAPFDKTNAAFQQRHWRDTVAALSCVALQYRGFHADPPMEGDDGGTMGGYEDSTAEITALTTKLVSWRESGSLFCGGAHPYNYSNAYNMNVASGELIGLSDIFADTVDGKPSPSLLAFVKEKRAKPSDQAGKDFEMECGLDELIDEYLVAGFKRDADKLFVVFGLHNLPHAVVACGDDLLELPAADVVKFMTPEFKALIGL